MFVQHIYDFLDICNLNGLVNTIMIPIYDQLIILLGKSIKSREILFLDGVA